MPRFRLVLEAATPISHGDTSAGGRRNNQTLFMRQGRLIDGELMPCPHVSENALRHVMVREPLADHLLAALGLDDQRGETHGQGRKPAADPDAPAEPGLPRAVVHLLYSGGSLGGVSIAADNVVLGHRIADLYPSLDLVSGSVAAFFLPTGALRLTSWLVARENLAAIQAFFPEEAAVADRAWGHDLIWEEQRTRMGQHSGRGEQMIYGYETLAAGARIAVEFTVDDHAPAATLGALALAIERWPGFVGSQGRMGRGRMMVAWSDLPDPAPYLEHIEANREAMRAGLLDGSLGAGRAVAA